MEREENNIEDLEKNIERVRKQLHKEILESGGNEENQEILKISRELDKLIVKYIEN